MSYKIPWWCLSFADDDGWLGGAYVQAPVAETAAGEAWRQGCNPGGEVQIIGPLHPSTTGLPPQEWLNRLLDRDDLADIDRIMLDKPRGRPVPDEPDYISRGQKQVPSPPRGQAPKDPPAEPPRPKKG